MTHATALEAVELAIDGIQSAGGGADWYDAA
jgi:hypothetical protein